MEQSEHYVTKSDYAYRALRAMILGGEVGPGKVLNQVVIARTIGVSTTPLRESLRRLAAEGLVELGAHKDARVTDLSADEARELREVRRSLDPVAAALAARRRTRDDIVWIGEALTEMARPSTRSRGGEVEAHRRFHAALYTASHNELLVHVLDGLWDKADRYLRRDLHERTEADRETEHYEHVALVDAVAAGDAETASAVMLRHLDPAGRRC